MLTVTHFSYPLQEAVADTLQELWISYNNVEKLKGITVLAKLKVRHTHCLEPGSPPAQWWREIPTPHSYTYVNFF